MMLRFEYHLMQQLHRQHNKKKLFEVGKKPSNKNYYSRRVKSFIVIDDGFPLPQNIHAVRSQCV